MTTALFIAACVVITFGIMAEIENGGPYFYD